MELKNLKAACGALIVMGLLGLAGLGVKQYVDPASLTSANNPQLYADSARQAALVLTPESQGTCVFIKRTNSAGNVRWFAWTAQHVVGANATVTIRVFHRTEGRKAGTSDFNAKVLRTSPSLDLALLFVNAPPDAFLGAEFAPYSPASPGDPVFSVGNFHGEIYDSSLSIGVISQVGRPVGREGRWPITDQTTCPIYPGSSGGPMFSADGRVLGIIVAGVNATLNFFVPVRAVEAWADIEDVEWAVRGPACPSDINGGYFVPVLPPAPKEEPLKNDAWYWRTP